MSAPPPAHRDRRKSPKKAEEAKADRPRGSNPQAPKPGAPGDSKPARRRVRSTDRRAADSAPTGARHSGAEDARALAHGRLRLELPEELPISRRARDIEQAIDRHQVVIVVGATGSGKTTQLPKMALAAGRGIRRRIAVTQPRRIAATSVAARVATEVDCPLGDAVGYQIRFEDKTSAATCVKFMTDGILLAEIQRDPRLEAYDTLIVDEAHERSLNIDFLLGWIKRILPQRPDLELVISSATIESQRLSEFFDGAPVIDVEGRTHPVDVWYEPPAEGLDLPRAVADSVVAIGELDPHGDILVFLPGEREIREAEAELRRRELRHTTVQPLYSRLSAADQRKVFATVTGRRVILATNVAETSLTLVGIVYVVDTGVARLSRYDPRTGTTRLQIEGISQASAEQRKGRCGRVREGVCLRLYDEQSFAARPEFTDPEMKRVGLSGVILRMKALGLGKVEDFPFLDAPHARAISEGYRVLEELGALDDQRELTPLGRRLARFPVDPRIARMILAAQQYGCLEEVIVIAAGLSIQDPRERPRGLEGKADLAHKRFEDTASDFLGLLRLWEFVRAARAEGTSRLRRACKESFLSFSRVREWMDLHRQLNETYRESQRGRRGRGRRAEGEGPEGPGAAGVGEGRGARQAGVAIHKALLSGLLSRIGQYNPKARGYTGARQTQFVLHPSSALAKKPPAWVMAFELVQTSRLFARTVARVDPQWLDEVGGHLLKRKRSEPHYSERSARATVREQATLFGLVVFRDRTVDYSTISPLRARLIFLEHALVRGEFESRGAFQAKNRKLLEEVSRLRDKARKSEVMADEESLLEFFDRRVPEHVVDGTRFEKWISQAEREDPEALVLSPEHVLGEEENLRKEDYPDAIILRGVEVPLSYCFDPHSERDGITLSLPLALMAQLHPLDLDWTIPGWHAEKVDALFDRLSKAHRRALGDLEPLARAARTRLQPFEGQLLPQLAELLLEETGVEIPLSTFPIDQLPAHLRLNFRVLGPGGAAVGEGRDLDELLRAHAPDAARALRAASEKSPWEREGLVSWSFGDLPPFVERTVLGTKVRAFVAIEPAEESVNLVLCQTPSAAEQCSRRGLQRLLTLRCRGALAALRNSCPPPPRPGPAPPPSKLERHRFATKVFERAVWEASELAPSSEPVRTQRQFELLAEQTASRLSGRCEAWLEHLSRLDAELQPTLRALHTALKQPSGRGALLDVQAQIAALFGDDFPDACSAARLSHYPRYLRAARSRVQRALNDPARDAERAAQLNPLLRRFEALGVRGVRGPELDEIRWDLEELRVVMFAPDVGRAYAIAPAEVRAALAELERRA